MNGKLRNMTSLYLSYENKILLLYRQGGRVVTDTWVASAGGHFEAYEINDAKACVLRELTEELGIAEASLKNLKMRYVTLRRTKEELRQNYYFFAELKMFPDIPLTSNEGTLKWVDISEIKTLEMPFTAKFVMEHYVETGRFNDKLYGGIANGESVIFTELPEF